MIRGGWIEKESNLSQEGKCWVDDDAKVYGNAIVYDGSQVFDNAIVYANAVVYGNAIVCGDAVIKDISDYLVFKNNWSSGRYFTWTKSNDMWSVGCFYGTGEELIKKAYIDSEKSGKCYETIVNCVKILKKC